MFVLSFICQESLLEKGAVDVVTGPDAYRDLPRLLGLVGAPGRGKGAGAVSVQVGFILALTVTVFFVEEKGEFCPRFSSGEAAATAARAANVYVGADHICFFVKISMFFPKAPVSGRPRTVKNQPKPKPRPKPKPNNSNETQSRQKATQSTRNTHTHTKRNGTHKEKWAKNNQIDAVQYKAIRETR